MTKLIYSHLYHISFTYFDRIENKECPTSLIQPYVSEDKLTTKEVEEIYLSRDSFSSMVKGMVERSFYKDRGYTKDSFEFREIKVTYAGYDRWWLTWFSHETKSQFDTDAEAYADFDKFIEEKGSVYEEKSMGAEDRWRWKICQCEHCVKSKQTIINH